VKMIGVEAGGKGIPSGKHASRFADSKRSGKGVIHGTHTYVLQDRYGQIHNTHSVAAGLDYPAVGPEHSMLRDIKRIKYTYATDSEALKAFKTLSEEEGIIPALESAHAVATGLKLAKKLKKNDIIIVNLSGRGDKDIYQIAELLGVEV
jgi:tryptophan synthase beta chain